MTPIPSAPPAPVKCPSTGYPTHLLARGRYFYTGITSNCKQRTVFYDSGGNFMRNQGPGSGAFDQSPRSGAQSCWKGNTCVYC